MNADLPNHDAPKPGLAGHPLGPVVYRVAAREPIKARCAAAVVLAGCALLLGTAVYLEPDGAGLGSHEQLGLPPCNVVMLSGYPCPTCGMTTAFAHMVRGELFSAFHAHPAGLALGLSTVIAASVSLSVLLTGRVLAVNWFRVSPTWVAVGAVVVILGGWGYKLAVGLLSGSLPMAR